MRICLSSIVSHFCFRGITCVDRELNSVLWRRFRELGATSFSSDVSFLTSHRRTDSDGLMQGLRYPRFGGNRPAPKQYGGPVQSVRADLRRTSQLEPPNAWVGSPGRPTRRLVADHLSAERAGWEIVRVYKDRGGGDGEGDLGLKAQVRAMAPKSAGIAKLLLFKAILAKRKLSSSSTN